MPEVKLSPDQRREVARRALAGETPTALGKEFGISRQHVHRIRDDALDLDAYRDIREEYELRRNALESRSLV